MRREFHLFYQVFRHGDHTPQEFFPTDKHKEVAKHQGYGQLTKVCLLTWANGLKYWNAVLISGFWNFVFTWREPISLCHL